jgi:hypothetical protein
MVLKKIISFVAHGRSALWEVRQKPGYIKHTESYFESKKCVTKLILRDTPSTYDRLKYHSSGIIFCFIPGAGKST